MSKYYKNDDPFKKPVTIVTNNPNEIFYQLSDGQMIKKDTFIKYYSVYDAPSVNENVQQRTSFSSDQIDVDSFFNTSTISMNEINKLKTIDPVRIKEDNIGTRVTVNTTNKMSAAPVFKPEQVIDKNTNVLYTPTGPATIPNNTNTDVSQYKVFDNDDDAFEDLMNKAQGVTPATPQKPQMDKSREQMLIEQDNARLLGGTPKIQNQQRPINENVQQPNIQKEVQLDPSEMMFKTFKRNHDLNININIKDKIGNPTFVKMMMENMEGDIIAYYKKIVMKNILENISDIENKVEAEIRKEIYGEEIEKPVVKEKKKQQLVKVNKKSKKTTESDLGSLVVNNIENEPVKKEIILPVEKEENIITVIPEVEITDNKVEEIIEDPKEEVVNVEDNSIVQEEPKIKTTQKKKKKE